MGATCEAWIAAVAPKRRSCKSGQRGLNTGTL